MRIRGNVGSGCGLASSPTNFSIKAREVDFGYRPEPGTLNIWPMEPLDDVEAKLRKAKHKRSVDAESPVKGFCLIWSAILTSPKMRGERVECFLIRHERNALPYLELMGRINFRKTYGLVDGDEMVLEILEAD